MGTAFEPLTSAIPVQRSSRWTNKAVELSSSLFHGFNTNQFNELLLDGLLA